MLRLAAAILLYGLLHLSGVTSTVTTIDIALRKDGQVVTNPYLKLNDTITIKCTYDAFNHPKQVLSIALKDTSGKKHVIFTPASTAEPWNSNTNRYNFTDNWDNPPFYNQLAIQGVTLSDAGEYFCEANGGPTAVLKKTAKINILANTDTIFLNGTENGKYVIDYSEAQVTKEVICTAFGGSEPKIKITIGNGQPANANVVKQNNMYIGRVQERFTPEMDGKEIKCTSLVQGYENEVKTSTATLEINSKPEINCPGKVEGELAKTVTIQCTVTGKPVPAPGDIAWRTPLTDSSFNGDGSVQQFGLKSSMEKITNGYKVTLKVTIDYDQHFTEYTLEAKSAAGGNTATVKLVKKPDTVKGPGGSAFSISSLSSLILLMIGCYALLI